MSRVPYDPTGLEHDLHCRAAVLAVTFVILSLMVLL